MQRPLPRIWILAALSAIALSACRDRPPQRPNADATGVLYVVRRSWHIDIGFAAADLQLPLASLRNEFPSAAYVEFGFGDRHYLMNQHHGAGNLLAALWPGAGLILMTALTGTPQQAFGTGNVLELRVTPAQSAQVQNFIWHTLTSDRSEVKPLAPGPYDGSAFYAAIPKYSALHTCNTWAAQTLQSADLPIHSAGVEFAGQLWSQARRLPHTRASDTGG
jgi:uncharacterized protein (TIGR02117 family)